MKKIVAIILAALMLLGAIACNALKPENDDKGENGENALLNEDPFPDYEGILKIIALLAKNSGVSEFENNYAPLDERETAIYNEIRERINDNLGYSIVDINDDGTDELVLLRGNAYTPSSVFTIKDDKPVFLTDIYSGENSKGAIDKRGVIYKFVYNKENDYYYEVKKIVDGELVGLTYGCRDTGKIEYFVVRNGINSDVTKEYLSELENEYADIFNKLELTTQNSHIGPYNHIIDCGPHYKLIEDPLSYKSHTYEIYNKENELVLSKQVNESTYIHEHDDVLDIVVMGSSYGFDVHTYYSLTRDAFSEEFTHIRSLSGDKVAYFENDRLIVRNVFDKNEFYREYPEYSSASYVSFAPDGKSLELRFNVEGFSKPATKVICFETLPILKTLKTRGVYGNLKFDLYFLSSGNPAHVRAATEDTLRLMQTETVIGDCYQTESGTRNDWYMVIYNGRVCYVEAAYFEVSSYIVTEGN